MDRRLELAQDRLSLVVSGWEVEPEAWPSSRGGELLVPLRQVAERLGWRLERGAAEVRLRKRQGSREIILRPGDRQVEVGRDRITLPVPVEAAGETLLAPIRSLAGPLGAGLYEGKQAGAVVILRRERALEGRRIAVDPGHGGHDGGASGAVAGEKELNLRAARVIFGLLQAAGACPVLTREADEDVPWPARLARAGGCEALVSIHHNSFPDPRVGGTETYYYQRNSARHLAHCLQTELEHSLGLAGRGVREANHELLRMAPLPAVQVEVCFLTNPAEVELAQSPHFHLRVGLALYRGIRSFFEDKARWEA